MNDPAMNFLLAPNSPSFQRLPPTVQQLLLLAGSKKSTLANLSHVERLRLNYLPTIFAGILTLTLSHLKKKLFVGTVIYYYIQTGLMT